MSSPLTIRPLDTHEQYRILKEYLLVKIHQEDWHGVTDAAVDLREFEVKHPEVKGS